MAVNNQHASSGRYVKEDGKNVNLADIMSSRVRSGSRVGVMDVSSTASPVFTDSSELSNRHEVLVFNDASIFLYWSFESNPTLGEDTMPIPSGGIVRFNFDPNDPQQIYLITSGLSSNVKVVELT